MAAMLNDLSLGDRTNDWIAYDYFLQGREFMHRYQKDEAEPLFAHGDRAMYEHWLDGLRKAGLPE